MALADLLPFRGPRITVEKTLNPGDQTVLARIFKAVTLAVGFRSTTITDRAQLQWAPYDFERIIQAVDTDSYIRQGFSKYRELIWKEGWELVSENPDAVTYLYERINFMELSMRQTFPDFLMEAVDQLIKFGNAFLAKSRGPLAPHFPLPLHTEEGMEPVIGYELIPTETVQIWRDKHNKPVSYRQFPDQSWTGSGFTDNDLNFPTWDASEVIHLYLDRKPGRAFGTPFMITVMDDVVALRQMEEDIQNLVHRELFPLYKYKVGTEEHPADPEEVDQAAAELAGLRTEGGLVLPERHDVEVIGAEGNALDVGSYLAHFKERVSVGMGLAPHHLGILSDDANRSVTDRLDIALYDKVKTIQRYVSRSLEFHVLMELLIEGGFDPVETPFANDISDRCFFKFREIDVDTQVKRETHEIQKFANNITTHPETRLALGLSPEAEDDNLLMGMQQKMAVDAASHQAALSADQAKLDARLAPTPTPAVAKSGGSVVTKGVSPAATKPDAQPPSKGGAPNRPNSVRKVGNIIRPANQFGRRTSPNIRHFDSFDLNGGLSELVALIDDDGSEE